MRQLVHEWQRLCEEPFGGRMLLRETKEAEGQMIPLFVWGLRQISALLEAQDHSEYFGDGTVQPPGRLAHCQPFRCASEQLQNIEALLQCGRRIVPLNVAFRHRLAGC